MLISKEGTVDAPGAMSPPTCLILLLFKINLSSNFYLVQLFFFSESYPSFVKCFLQLCSSEPGKFFPSCIAGTDFTVLLMGNQLIYLMQKLTETSLKVLVCRLLML